MERNENERDGSPCPDTNENEARNVGAIVAEIMDGLTNPPSQPVAVNSQRFGCGVQGMHYAAILPGLDSSISKSLKATFSPASVSFSKMRIRQSCGT